MTNDTMKAPDQWVWLAAFYFVLGILSSSLGGAFEWLAKFVFMVLSGSALWTIGRWLVFRTQERMRVNRG